MPLRTFTTLILPHCHDTGVNTTSAQRFTISTLGKRHEMMLKHAILAALSTISLCVLGIAGDATFGTNRVWARVEEVINFPGAIALAIVGPGHGFAQLVFPGLFSLLFYFVAFWAFFVYARRRE